MPKKPPKKPGDGAEPEEPEDPKKEPANGYETLPSTSPTEPSDPVSYLIERSFCRTLDIRHTTGPKPNRATHHRGHGSVPHRAGSNVPTGRASCPHGTARRLDCQPVLRVWRPRSRVEAVLDARTTHVADIDRDACTVLARRFPDAPTLGTCAPSTGRASTPTSSPLATHASRSATPAAVKENTMSDTSGPKFCEPFVHYDPDSSCWRTSEATFPWGSDEFSETWPKRGSMRNGVCYERQMSAPPRAGTSLRCCPPHGEPTGRVRNRCSAAWRRWRTAHAQQ